MPKSREESGLNKDAPRNCGFCGHHKDDVPLLVVSSVTKAAVCSFCALGVIEQTFKHGMDMEVKLRELMSPPKIEIVSADTQPDKVDIAIGKALNHGK